MIGGYREHEEIMKKLYALRQNLSESNDKAKIGLHEIQESLLKEVRRNLNQEISKLHVDNSQSRPELAAKLRHLAESVVRPLSHELLFTEPPTDSLKIQSHVDSPRFHALRDVVARARPSNILLVPITLELLITPFLLAQYDLKIAVLNLILSTPCLILSNFLMKKLWPKEDLSLVRASSLIMAYWLAGGLCAIPIYIVSQLAYWGFPLYWGNSFFFLMFTILFVSLQALDARRHEIQNQLSWAVKRQALEVAEFQKENAEARRRVGKFLHSRVQAEIVSNMLELSLSDNLEISNIESKLNAFIRDLDSHTGNLDEHSSSEDALSQILEVWRGFLDVEIDAISSVWSSIDRRPDWKLFLIDIVSEGLTNAVKHAESRKVKIKIVEIEDQLSVAIESIGQLTSNFTIGAGLKSLAISSTKWSISQSGDEVILEARRL